MIKSKIIQSSEPNPYLSLKYVEGPGQFQVSQLLGGHYISVYEKSYTGKERLHKLLKSIRDYIWLKFHRQFHTDYYSRKNRLERSWHVFYKGLLQKNLITQYPNSLTISFNISTISSDILNLKPITEEGIIKKQQELNERKIGLALNPNPTLKNKNQLLKENQRDFLKDMKESAVDETVIEAWSRAFAEMDCISFEELKKGLQVCCESLKHIIGSADYSIGFTPKKSSKWLAEQALCLMDDMPKTSFTPKTINFTTDRSHQSDIDVNCRHFVIFDDAAYSGTQLQEMIEGIKTQIEERGDFRHTYHLYLVVPFISSYAQEKLQTLSKSLAKPGQLKINIITTDRLVKDRPDYFKYGSDLAGKIGLGYQGACFSITEWKHPDSASFPEKLRKASLFLKESDREGKRLVYSEKKDYEFTSYFTPPYKLLEMNR